MEEGGNCTDCSSYSGLLLASWLTMLFPFNHSPEKIRTASSYVMLLLVGAWTSKQLGLEGENKDVWQPQMKPWYKKNRVYFLLLLLHKIWLRCLLDQILSWLFFSNYFTTITHQPFFQDRCDRNNFMCLYRSSK